MRAFDPRPEAAEFWRRVGEAEPFPRELRRPVTNTLPVAVVHLPRLTISDASAWLSERGVEGTLTAADRPLRGCLVAHRGHGFIFLDGGLEPDEERVTLSQEVSHFVRHYERRRVAAARKMGPAILEALDGDRPLTAAERVSAVLRDIPVGVYRHTMGRDGAGRPDAHTMELEAEADLLGFELLAPSWRVAKSSMPGADCRELLQVAYGFPSESALAWARWIDARRAPDPFLARLEVAAKKVSD